MKSIIYLMNPHLKQILIKPGKTELYVQHVLELLRTQILNRVKRICLQA